VHMRSRATADALDDDHAIEMSSLRFVSVGARQALLRGARRRVLTRGDPLTESMVGDPWSILVTTGIVRLYATIDGVQPTLLYAGRGALLGSHWTPPATHEVWQVAVEAVTPSTVIQLDPVHIGRLLGTAPGFARGVLTEIQAGLWTVASTLAIYVTASLAQRLAREILILNDLHAEELIPVTEQQLADGIGSLRESVARSIGEFRERGILATTRFGFVVLDLKGLQQLSRGA
jgi:CRP/FNR family transcriptional regulator, cyclic AMP receptor protein